MLGSMGMLETAEHRSPTVTVGWEEHVTEWCLGLEQQENGEQRSC